MNTRNKRRYPLDTSGIIHLAVLRKNHSNSFRLSAAPRETVDPSLLQKAFCFVTPRFSALVAGIQAWMFRGYVVPVEQTPKVIPNHGLLRVMSPEQIRLCAVRVLYREETISVEFFHALTDGYGGAVFLKVLLAEYLKLAHSMDFSDEETMPLSSTDSTAETEDSFARYARNGRDIPHSESCYQPMGVLSSEDTPRTTTVILNVKELLQAAHGYHVTLTEFFTTILAEAVMDMQTHRPCGWEGCKPVRIMVPVDLRNWFPSKTLRNFSLYALPRVRPEDMVLSFGQLSARVSEQLREQLSGDVLQAMIAAGYRLQRHFRWLPLKIKCAALRLSYRFCSGKNSSLTLSNLGSFTLPEKMRPYIRRTGFFLTPRLYSARNLASSRMTGACISISPVTTPYRSWRIAF